MVTGRTLRRSAASLAAAAVLLVSSCSIDSSPEEGGPSPAPPDRGKISAPQLEPLSADVPDTLQPYYEQRLDWRRCNFPGFECATLTVPLDYEHPAPADDLQLAVTRRQTTGPGDRVGSLLVNPGGPGASAVDFVQANTRYLLPESVRARYDIVGLDARGTGGSHPVTCLTGEEMDAYSLLDHTPDSKAEIAELVDGFEEFGQSCQKRSGRLLEHISTIESARDLDVLRAVLGDERLHYLGISYGTKLGATFAGLFPQRVGRLVLDAAMDPRLSTLVTDREQAGGFETAFRSFAEDCTVRDDCPLGTDGPDDASQRLRDFFAELDAEPLPTGDPDRSLTESLAATGVGFGLYAQQLWPQLRDALTAALEEGDGSPLLGMSDAYLQREADGSYDPLISSFMAISCLDSPPAVKDVSGVESVVSGFEKASPTFGRDFAWGALQCATWPVEPTGAPVAIEAADSEDILVIGTTRDPATPYAWAQGLADQLDAGILLTYDGDGHGAYNTQGDSCVTTAVNRYLLENTSPKEATTCP